MASSTAPVGEGQEETLDTLLKESTLIYKIDDKCPVYIGVLYGLQNVLRHAASVVGIVFILHSAMCGGEDRTLFAELISAFIFSQGFGTVLEIIFGIRMPLIEGVSYSYIGPIISSMSTFPCQPVCTPGNNATETCAEKPWLAPLLEINGSLMLASGVQTLFGLTGAAGFLLRYISSLTIAVTMTLLGLSMVSFVAASAGNQWGIAIGTFGLYCLFGLVLAKVELPIIPSFGKDGFGWKKFPLFRTFSALLAMSFAWLLCFILTETDVFTDNQNKTSYQARTDIKTSSIEEAEWFSIPYPGRYGVPTIGIGVFVGFLGSVVVSTVESIGDYYAFSRACELPPPPAHTVNRGIAVEGLIGILHGASGVCLGATSYSPVVGMISVTGMACRMGWIIVGVVFMLAGVVGKLGAALSMVPLPVIAGINIASIGMTSSVGLSCLQFVDLKSVRNLAILGSSLMLGLAVPQYMADNTGVIQTGNKDLDQVLTILLTTNMMVGGVASFILDNIIPGTKEERGLLTHSKLLQARVYSSEPLETQIRKAYDFPHITDWLRRFLCCRLMPFMPSYDENLISHLRRPFRHEKPTVSQPLDGVANGILSTL